MRPPRIRARISLRVFLVVVLLTGVWLGWRIDRARRQRRAVAEVEQYNGYVLYDYEFRNGQNVADAVPNAPRWLRRYLGDEYFREVGCVRYNDQPPSDATLLPLATFPGLEELSFGKRPFHAKAPVKPPPGLEGLTELGLSRIEALTHVRRLELEWMPSIRPMLRRLHNSSDLEELKIFESDDVEDPVTEPDRDHGHRAGSAEWTQELAENRLDRDFRQPPCGG
jgi:hypothetical protein